MDQHTQEQLRLKNEARSDKLPDERGERLDSGYQSFTSISSSEKNSIFSIPSLPQVIEETGLDTEELDEGISSLSLPAENEEGVKDFHVSKPIQASTEEQSSSREEESAPFLIFSEDEDGDTKLHIAVIQNEIKLVNYFIEVALQYDLRNEMHLLEIQNDLCQTALHLAVLTENNESLSSLMVAGCCALMQDHNGDTALHIACRGCNEKAVYIILENTNRKQELLETVNYDGEKCIHVCTSLSHMNIISKLCENRVDINGRENKAGLTLLHMAANFGNAELVSYLIEQDRINLEECTFNDVTALMLAKSRDRSDIVYILETAGSQYNEIESDPESDDEI